MLPVILPPQSQPVTDGNLLERTWYLFLETVRSAMTGLLELIQFGTDAERLAFNPVNLLPGSLWIDTPGAIYYWTGTAWLNVGGNLEDTHANRIANYPAANYAVGTLFFETNPTQTDRQSLYAVQLNNSGAHEWAYVSGWCEKTFANRPSDLGASDAGFEFYSTDYTVTERWNGTNWIYVSGIAQGAFGLLTTLSGLLSASEAGWLLADSTYGHTWIWDGTWTFAQGEQSQYIVMAPAAPQGGVWYPCDGGSYTCTNANATTTSITTPALNSNVAAIMGGGMSNTLNPATAATAATTQGITAGGAGPAIVALNAPSVLNGGLPQYFTTSWWLRA